MTRCTTARIAVGLTGALASAAGAGVSDVTTFTDRAAFESVAGVGTELIFESFEDKPVGEVPLPFTFAGSGLELRSLGASSGEYVAAVTDSSVFSQPSDGELHLGFSFGQGPYAPQFRTPGLSFAFGFDLSGYQDFDDSDTIDLELWREGSFVTTAVLPRPDGLGPGFLGVISELWFDEVRIVVEDGGLTAFGDYVGVDLVTIGVIPGPGVAAVLALAGVAGAGRGRRRG